MVIIIVSVILILIFISFTLIRKDFIDIFDDNKISIIQRKYEFLELKRFRQPTTMGFGPSGGIILNKKPEIEFPLEEKIEPFRHPYVSLEYNDWIKVYAKMRNSDKFNIIFQDFWSIKNKEKLKTRVSYLNSHLKGNSGILKV